MAHMAKLDKNNIVLRVESIHDNELKDGNGEESEAKGIEFCRSLYGQDTDWAQTSYNATFGGKFAAPGDIYDPKNKIFKSPIP